VNVLTVEGVGLLVVKALVGVKALTVIDGI
jgi:hypothetical protein